jgi:hypothetical protein
MPSEFAFICAVVIFFVSIHLWALRPYFRYVDAVKHLELEAGHIDKWKSTLPTWLIASDRSFKYALRKRLSQPEADPDLEVLRQTVIFRRNCVYLFPVIVAAILAVAFAAFVLTMSIRGYR